MNVTIVETGTANLASVTAAFRRLGADVTRTRDATILLEAERVVLPGVGTFSAGMDALGAAGLVQAIRDRAALERPTFGICLGLQLLGRDSEESPGVDGVGVIDANVRALDPSAPVPQMGWNRISANDGVVLDGWAYFANSFAFDDVPAQWRPSWASHGGRRFVAAVERGPLFASQFHPELSGDLGQTLIKRWLEGTSC